MSSLGNEKIWPHGAYWVKWLQWDGDCPSKPRRVCKHFPVCHGVCTFLCLLVPVPV